MCPNSFYTRPSLRDYIFCHTKEIRFACNQCDFKTHLRSSLKKHVKRVQEQIKKFQGSFHGDSKIESQLFSMHCVSSRSCGNQWNERDKEGHDGNECGHVNIARISSRYFVAQYSKLVHDAQPQHGQSHVVYSKLPSRKYPELSIHCE